MSDYIHSLKVIDRPVPALVLAIASAAAARMQLRSMTSDEVRWRLKSAVFQADCMAYEVPLRRGCDRAEMRDELAWARAEVRMLEAEMARRA